MTKEKLKEFCLLLAKSYNDENTDKPIDIDKYSSLLAILLETSYPDKGKTALGEALEKIKDKLFK